MCAHYSVDPTRIDECWNVAGSVCYGNQPRLNAKHTIVSACQYDWMVCDPMLRMALARESGSVSDRTDVDARSDLDLEGHQGRTQLTWGERASRLGLCLGVTLVILAVVTPR
jgi:hypothetical protein